MEVTSMMGETSSQFKITPHKFSNTIKLLIEKPHVINKKVCGFELKWIGVAKTLFDVQQILKCLEPVLQVKKISNEGISTFDSAIEVLLHHGFESDESNSSFEEIPWSRFLSLPDKNSLIAVVRNILPRNAQMECSVLEVIIMDGHFAKIMFISEAHSTYMPELLPEFPYTLTLNQGKIQLETFNNEFKDGSSYKRLKDRLLPIINKWAVQMKEDDCVNIVSSNRLVNIKQYNKTYQELKGKYGQYLMKIWTETTDPLKFIYEDIAIATYLLVLWEQERNEKGMKDKQSFIDLGCGNGLLVYLLASEGHPGMGIDIKSRKLWEKFPDYVSLKEDVVLPSDKCLYPDYDWLIGNHSDELTPWLPVIAAKSSISTRFFVIPCCAHDFQTKFQRKKGGVSQYAEYLDYIEHIGTECGFDMWKDRLRIPSTKRICFVGQNRTYDSNEWNNIRSHITQMVNSRCSSVQDFKIDTKDQTEPAPDQGSWCTEFKARESIQRVRNCTQIKREIKDEIVNKICFLLLDEENFIKVIFGLCCLHKDIIQASFFLEAKVNYGYI
ncbi:UNVERIFIED_CONTAM: hypothetical protein GTU68_005968 [Idotea baltica]|nr:hypothetical protein [Idotea baltica]